MSNNGRFDKPSEALVMGAFLFQGLDKVDRNGNTLPGLIQEILVLCWEEDKKIREGTVSVTRPNPQKLSLEKMRESFQAGDIFEINEKVYLYFGAPHRDGELFVEQEKPSEDFTLSGTIAGEFLRFVPISKSGRRRPRLIPFVAVQGDDGHLYMCRVEGGREWETTPDDLLGQMAARHEQLRQMYPGGRVTITPFGRGGYWQVVPQKEANPLSEVPLLREQLAAAWCGEAIQ